MNIMRNIECNAVISATHAHYFKMVLNTNGHRNLRRKKC